MKANIRKSQYASSPDTDGWWTWRELCNQCGGIIHLEEDVMILDKPSPDSEDYCIDCLAKKFNEEKQ